MFLIGHLSLADRGLHPLQAGSHLLLICGATAWLRLSQFRHFTGHSSQPHICYEGTEPNLSLSCTLAGRAGAAVLVLPGFVIMGVSISHLDKLRLCLYLVS